MGEVELGQMAQQRATDPEVKQFAEMMVRDHTKAKNELKQAVKGSGIDEPKQLDKKHQALYDMLSQLNGAAFDREYMAAMVDGDDDPVAHLAQHVEERIRRIRQHLHGLAVDAKLIGSLHPLVLRQTY